MLRYKGISILEYWKLRKIARKVRAGLVPDGVEPEEILRAMKLTQPKSVLEMLGLLSAKVQRTDGTFKDYGLVSVKLVTTVFAEYLVDIMTSSGEPATGAMDEFHFHKMGAGSSAEGANETALVTQQDGAQTGTDGAAVCTHGAQSSIYVTIGTLTAGSAYGCREHGVFNASTGGTLLDRSVVTNIELAEEDVVTWTYSLTVTPGG
jgi:hypothetical protein